MFKKNPDTPGEIALMARGYRPVDGIRPKPTIFGAVRRFLRPPTAGLLKPGDPAVEEARQQHLVTHSWCRGCQSVDAVNAYPFPADRGWTEHPDAYVTLCKKHKP